MDESLSCYFKSLRNVPQILSAFRNKEGQLFLEETRAPMRNESTFE